MTLNYWVIVERFPFLNGVVGSSIPTMKSFLYFTGKKLSRWVRSQEPTHRKISNKPHPAPRGFLSRVEPTCSKPHQVA
jgi:hypothetical protein